VRNPARGVFWSDEAESGEWVDAGKVCLVDKPSTPREHAELVLQRIADLPAARGTQ